MPEHRPVTKLRRWLPALVWLVWLGCRPVAASEVLIDGAAISAHGSLWRIRPHLRWQVDPPVIEAIHSGVAVRFQLKGQLIKSAPLWPDSVFDRQTITLEVRYFSLSKQYLLKNIGAGHQRGFLSLDNLWQHLGKSVELKLPRNPAANAAAIRLRLDTGALPAAMQLPTLFDAAWKLDTGWRVFPLPVGEERQQP